MNDYRELLERSRSVLLESNQNERVSLYLDIDEYLNTQKGCILTEIDIATSGSTDNDTV